MLAVTPSMELPLKPFLAARWADEPALWFERLRSYQGYEINRIRTREEDSGSISQLWAHVSGGWQIGEPGH
ncbi:hypothetical protein PIB30_060980 [Stylosanthes scabra]|uniref:Uncharacterized protein n=1 Tax=Stylosanthes scabra TaxID=79078 RepID=A0ABU6UN49_9FABA|nr:hypothetical protein [Stylosanthes scabra]